MRPTLPIGTLTDLARTRTDEAARALAILRDGKLTANQKLEQLLAYRRDYTAQLQSMMARGIEAAQLSNYHQFLAALDAGIEQQRVTSLQAEADVSAGRSDWQHKRRRLNAFETLTERLQRQQQLLEGRREQRANDEQASRMFIDRAVRAY